MCATHGDPGQTHSLKEKKVALADLLDTRAKGVLIRSRFKSIWDPQPDYSLAWKRKMAKKREYSMFMVCGLEQGL